MIPLILAAASVAMTAYQASQQKEAGKQAQAAANYNAQLAEAEAIQRQLETTENYRRMKLEGAALTSRQRMQYAKGGVVSNTGTPLEVMSETVGILELQAQEAARLGRAEQARLKSEATLLRLGGQQARQASNYQAIGTIGAGALGAASSYYSMTRK